MPARAPRPPVPTPLAGEWTVHGGTDVDVDDLYALSTTCRLLATATDRVASQVATACLRAEAALALATLGSVGRGPDLGALGRAPGAASALLTASALPAGAAAGLAALGLRVVWAADRYVDAESGAAAAVREAGQALGYVERLAGRKPVAGRVADGGAPPDSVLDPGAEADACVEAVGGARSTADAGSPAAAGSLADADSLPELAAGPLAALYPRRTATVGPATDLGEVPPPRGVAGLLALVAGRAGTGPPPPGRVDVVAVRTSDAEGRPRTAYVVALPGTTDWSPPGRTADPAHVRTLQANLQLMSGNATAEVAALPEALAAAGVPAGATVVLVGHSQGGMTARAAAADPLLLARYRVGGVLTAGSPTGAMAAPAPGVPVLALENAGDGVPALDGRRNLDGESRSTVTFAPADGPTEPGTRALDLPAPGAHDLDGYIAAAARVEQDRDWRLTTFAGRLRELGVAAPDASGPGGATATITRVELRLAPA